ncbi:oxidoreductase [Nocardioides allogilvus]|uniref:oxidoreductase n=1 Tax=Nocardioides allogilvus TaxID=2072017 RepID=UPI0018E4DC54|nr:NADH:flavin oxidoreductase [Nocardioides allogilvus]
MPTEPVANDALFSTFTIGALQLPNRVAVAPMTRVSATADGVVTDRMVDYYEGFARGGFGLIITEGIYIDTDHSQGYLNQPGLTNAEQELGWSRVVERVHAAGGKIFAQLMHAGSHSQGNPYATSTLAPSPITPRGQQLTFYRGEGPYTTPREITREEMTDVQTSFTCAARRAVAAGFDGVELHGANGYLLDQFLTDYLNERSDEYGGSAENRIRFAAEACASVIAEVGSEIAVGIRISQGKVSDGDHRWSGATADAVTIFETLGRTGIDFLHTTEYQALAPAFATGSETLADLAKQHGRVPVIVNGQLDQPEAAREILRSGSADIIALGKAALANRDWPRRVRDGVPVATELRDGTLGPIADIKDWELGD